MLKYLFLKGCAGLGNRLVTVMAAIEYCKKNNRILIVDWTDGQFDIKYSNAFEKCFEFINFIDYTSINGIKDINNLSTNSKLFKSNIKLGVYDLYEEKKSVFFSKLPERLFPKGSFRKLRKRWQPIENKSIFKSLCFGSDLKDNLLNDLLFYVDFLPPVDFNLMPYHIAIKDFIKQKIETFAINNNFENVIGIHIRFTDKKPDKSIARLLMELEKTKLEKRIFLSTDSVDVENIFLKKFPDTLLYPKQKPQLNGEGLHQWALYKKEDDLKYTIFEESVIEMFLLSRCNYLYYQGNSTFSRVSNAYHLNAKNCVNWLDLS